MAPIVAKPRLVLPSKNCTWPLGLGAPAGAPEIVAVREVGTPVVPEAGRAVSWVTVFCLLIVKVVAFEVDPT